MSNRVNTIFNDIMIDEPADVKILSSPYLDDLTDRTKIEALYQFLLRANKRRHRKQTLTYAYYLEQLIESDPIIAKRARRIVSKHYYITLTRVYYIFKSCSEQIERIRVMTLNMIRQLRIDEYVLLTFEV